MVVTNETYWKMIVIRQPFECRFNDEFYCSRERKSVSAKRNGTRHEHWQICVQIIPMQEHARRRRHNARKPIDCHYGAITNDHMLHVTMIFGYCIAVPSNCRSDISIFLVSIVLLVCLLFPTPTLDVFIIAIYRFLSDFNAFSLSSFSFAACNTNNL